MQGVEREAANELLESWRRTLAGQTQPKNYSQDLNVGHIDRGWTISPEHHGVIVFHVQLEHKEIHTPSQKAAANSSEKTLAKQRLTDNSPLGTYLGRLNLYPSKFDSISVAS